MDRLFGSNSLDFFSDSLDGSRGSLRLTSALLVAVARDVAKSTAVVALGSLSSGRAFTADVSEVATVVALGASAAAAGCSTVGVSSSTSASSAFSAFTRLLVLGAVTRDVSHAATVVAFLVRRGALLVAIAGQVAYVSAVVARLASVAVDGSLCARLRAVAGKVAGLAAVVAGAFRHGW